MINGFSLHKEERLRGERAISNLFENGQSFFHAPYRVFWIKIAETGLYPSRFAVSAPKKRFKRAVKRNLLKRRTREVFRLNKQILNEAILNDGITNTAKQGQVHLMFIYSSEQVMTTKELDGAMKKILRRISLQLQPSVFKRTSIEPITENSN